MFVFRWRTSVYILFRSIFCEWRVTISEDDDDDSLFSRCYKLRTMVVTTTQRIKSSARSKKTSSTSCSGRINQETTKIFKIQGRCHWGHEFQEFWRRCEHCVIVRLRIPFLRRHFSTKKFFLIFFPHRTSVWVFMGVFFFHRKPVVLRRGFWSFPWSPIVTDPKYAAFYGRARTTTTPRGASRSRWYWCGVFFFWRETTRQRPCVTVVTLGGLAYSRWYSLLLRGLVSVRHGLFLTPVMSEAIRMVAVGRRS